MSRDLEKTLVETALSAKEAQFNKLVKQFRECKNYEERIFISAKMDVLDGVVFDHIHAVRAVIK